MPRRASERGIGPDPARRSGSALGARHGVERASAGDRELRGVARAAARRELVELPGDHAAGHVLDVGPALREEVASHHPRALAGVADDEQGPVTWQFADPWLK